MTSKRRRSPGEGSVFEYATKAGVKRYGIKFTATMPDGTRKPVLRRRGPNGEPWTTRTAANAAIRDVMAEVAKGQWSEPSKMPLGVFLDEWLGGLRVKPSTLASYRKNVRLHIAPALGAVPLAQLTGPRITKLYRELETGGRKDHQAGQPLSARTVRYVATILRAALQAAVDTDLIPRNPADKANPPSAEQARAPEMHPWRADELRTFLDWAQAQAPAPGHDDRTTWHVLAFTGMRRGEALALRWRDVDLDAATVSVRRSVGAVRVKGEGERLIEGSTKTAKPRVVDLDAATVAALRGHRRERGALSLALVRPDALIFGDTHGNYLHPTRFSRRFVEAVARCRRQLGDAAPAAIRLHDMRHTHATLLLAAGVPVKVVSERLGHASVTVTLTIYAHVMPAMGRQAADTFAQLLDPPATEPPAAQEG